MTLVKLYEIDEKRLSQTLKAAKIKMNNSGNFQWYNDYPNVENFLNDIKNGVLYGFFNDEQLIGVVALTTDYEKHYYITKNKFRFKQESDNILYIHRLVRLAGVKEKALGEKFLKLIQKNFQQNYSAIQIDTNKMNIPMQKAILKSDFKQVGSFNRIEMQSPNWLCYEYVC